jgi:hypothetical protein
MAYDWHIGQRVVCIDDRCERSRIYKWERFPVEGSIYTIRAIVSCDDVGPVAFRLAEIRNKPAQYEDRVRELSFFARRFRPLVEPEADISAFISIIDRVNKQESVDA